MPPANSPSDTRPSTPPRRSPSPRADHSVVDDPYLRQLDHISSPVPDLAATLLAIPRPPSPAPTQSLLPGSFESAEHPESPAAGERPWEGHLSLSFHLDPELPGLELERLSRSSFLRPSYLTELEFQSWSPESRRRATMSNQPSTLRDRPRPRPSYQTSGGGPVRQSLYDWAAHSPSTNPREHTLSDDDGNDVDAMTTAHHNADVGARRDLQRLERALQSYRSARNALRQTNRSSDFGRVPTASALRAYWNDEPAGERSQVTQSTDSLRERTARPRRDWNEMHIQLLRDREHRAADRRTLDRASPPLLSLRAALGTRPEREPSEAFVRICNTIRYLSQLRHTGVQGGLELARDLGLDSLYEAEHPTAPSDLPMHIDSLPTPQYSSWLQPGMVWRGLQSTDRETGRSSNWDAPMRQEEQRLHLRMALARRREQERDLGAASTTPYSLLGDSNSHATSSSSVPQPVAPSSEADHWPVDVTIHSVDYSTMTLTGTMSASHIPDKISSTDSPNSDGTTSMSSYFTGEIIDFRAHPLETEATGRDYRIGGRETDARYWSRLGPFKREVERARLVRGLPRDAQLAGSRLWDAFQKAASEKVDEERRARGERPRGISPRPGRPSDQESATGAADTAQSPLSDTASTINPQALHEDAEIEDDAAMARALCSTRWLQNLGEEWILMRWKEQCFVTSSSSTSQSPDAAASTHTRNRTILTSSGSGSSVAHTSWGLTISGFYYIALNRLSGEIDGLYYDPGSQPYQQLKMVPDGMKLGRRCDQSEADDVYNGSTCGCGQGHCTNRVGLKKWFPSVEFR